MLEPCDKCAILWLAVVVICLGKLFSITVEAAKLLPFLIFL